MANSKKYNIHAAICPDCNGNGYIKAVLEEGREHVVLQCETCDSEGRSMWMSPKLWSLISMLIILQIVVSYIK
jgi:DnaJ-class molecular chaperone